ncbi:hypothetical protein CR513_53802, partial [Mucuna pruriens]
MTAWSVKLFEFSLKYKLRGIIKFQVLANFIIKMASTPEPTLNGLGTLFRIRFQKTSNNQVKHIPREDNMRANMLSKLAISKTGQY